METTLKWEWESSSWEQSCFLAPVSSPPPHFLSRHSRAHHFCQQIFVPFQHPRVWVSLEECIPVRDSLGVLAGPYRSKKREHTWEIKVLILSTSFEDRVRHEQGRLESHMGTL